MGRVETGDTRAQPVTSAWQILASWLGQVQQALCALRVMQSRSVPLERVRCDSLRTVARVKARLGSHDWDNLGNGDLAAEFRCWLTGVHRRLLSDIPYVVNTKCVIAKCAKALALYDLTEGRKVMGFLAP